MNRTEMDLVGEIMNGIEKDLVDEITLLNERVDMLSNSLRIVSAIGTFVTIILITMLEKGGVF